MGVFEFIVIIVAIGCAVPVAQAWIESRTARDTAGSQATEAQLARLEARVRTLERIVTDRGYDLREAIDRLEADGSAEGVDTPGR